LTALTPSLGSEDGSGHNLGLLKLVDPGAQGVRVQPVETLKEVAGGECFGNRWRRRISHMPSAYAEGREGYE
jgi:hypothetical protein